MSLKRTLQIGEKKLKDKNFPIKDFNKELLSNVEDLSDTMRANSLVGLAGPQIGINKRVFVSEIMNTKTRKLKKEDGLRVYINPKIVKFSKEQVVIFEGCGSVCHGVLFGPVKRPKTITIEAFDESGKKFRLKCDGLLARVIQHEYDHLDGIESLEKVYDTQKLMDVEVYRKEIKTDPKYMKLSEITVLEYTEL
jgi:peptide deformylase